MELTTNNTDFLEDDTERRFCEYCFEIISEDCPYVVYQGRNYHKDCYEILCPEGLELDEEIDGE